MGGDRYDDIYSLCFAGGGKHHRQGEWLSISAATSSHLYADNDEFHSAIWFFWPKAIPHNAIVPIKCYRGISQHEMKAYNTAVPNM